MKRFFNTDLHISVVADLQHIFHSLGHAIDDWCMSAHHWVLRKERRASPVLHWNNWQHIDQHTCAAFFATHRSELASYDGFVVTHCPAFALLFEPWQKPIIVVVSTRYNNGFEQRPTQLSWIDSGLRRMIDSRQATVVANNHYDAWHCSHCLGLPRPLPVIESLCEYTGMAWMPSINEVLFDQGRLTAVELPKGATFMANRNWPVISRYRAILHLPYNISTMSYFEQYTAGIPLVFPSRRLLGSDRCLLTELGTPAGDSGLADFYQWPAVAYFDSFEELGDRLLSLDVDAMHSAMTVHNACRHQLVYQNWVSIIEGL